MCSVAITIVRAACGNMHAEIVFTPVLIGLSLMCQHNFENNR